MLIGLDACSGSMITNDQKVGRRSVTINSSDATVADSLSRSRDGAGSG